MSLTRFDKYLTPDTVLQTGKKILGKSIRNFILPSDIGHVEQLISKYGKSRKGFLGELIEKFLFEIENNTRAEADFNTAGVELKTSPLVFRKKLVAKERLVFSKINYTKIIDEVWNTSSFLNKNKLILLMLYLYEKDKSLLDYEFKHVELIDLLSKLPTQDIYQIQKDWEFIVSKIQKGEAHLLSEGDTYYLGACTKAATSKDLTVQPNSEIKAKPRAFCFKVTYMNALVQSYLGNTDESASIFEPAQPSHTIEEQTYDLLSKYIGLTDTQILAQTNWRIPRDTKQYQRLIVNRLLTGDEHRTPTEYKKANIELKVITLEPDGRLVESLSFPHFEYLKIVNEEWEKIKGMPYSSFHELLETKKFLFVIFQKVSKSNELKLKGFKFWNFPQTDISTVQTVFEKTKDCIRNGNYQQLPKISDDMIAHVRPHAKNALDRLPTPQGTTEIKRSFWLNAKYIQKSLGFSDLDQS